MEAALILLLSWDLDNNEKKILPHHQKFEKHVKDIWNDKTFTILIIQIAKPILMSAVGFAMQLKDRRLYTAQYF